MKRTTLFFATLCLPVFVLRADPSYLISGFDPPVPFVVSFPNAINQSGQVVGMGTTNLSSFVPFVSANGVTTSLASPGGGVFDGAYGINDSGLIVGQINGVASSYSGGTWTSLATLPHDSTVAAVNNSGVAVGSTAVDGANEYRALVYSGGIATEIGSLGGTKSQASGINNSGQIVGNSDITGDSTYHAFIYQSGIMTDLGTLNNLDPLATSQAISINDSGQVVGISDVAGGTSHAFIWDSVNGMTDLGAPGAADYSQANGINNLGQVVGLFDDGDGQGGGFFFDGSTMWNLQDLITNLDDLPPDFVLHAVYAINDAGQIIGIGGGSDGGVKGYLLTPTPEPSTWLLLGLGLGVLVWSVRKKARV